MNILEKHKNIGVPILTPQEEERTFFRIRGRVEEEAVRYNQAGMASGWIKVGGKKYEVDRPSFYVERDHSWGLRRDGVPEIGVQLPDIPEGYIYSWAIMQFPTWGAAYHIRELADGTQLLSSGEIFYSYGSQKEALKVNRIEHDFQFQPNRRKVTSARVRLHAVDGSAFDISMRPLSYVCLLAGGYFEHNGFVNGKWMGENWSDEHKLDLTDPAVLDDVSLLDNTSCELKCGDEVGYGVLEVIVFGKHPKYG